MAIAYGLSSRSHGASRAKWRRVHIRLTAPYAATPLLFVRLYDWAWFIGVIAALLIYAGLMRKSAEA